MPSATAGSRSQVRHACMEHASRAVVASLGPPRPAPLAQGATGSSRRRRSSTSRRKSSARAPHDGMPARGEEYRPGRSSSARLPVSSTGQRISQRRPWNRLAPVQAALSGVRFSPRFAGASRQRARHRGARAPATNEAAPWTTRGRPRKRDRDQSRDPHRT